MMSARKPMVEEEMSTKAAVSLLRDQVEKAIHPFYGTRGIFEWGRALRLPSTVFGCSRLGTGVHSWRNRTI